MMCLLLGMIGVLYHLFWGSLDLLDPRKCQFALNLERPMGVIKAGWLAVARLV